MLWPTKGDVGLLLVLVDRWSLLFLDDDMKICDWVQKRLSEIKGRHQNVLQLSGLYLLSAGIQSCGYTTSIDLSHNKLTALIGIYSLITLSFLLSTCNTFGRVALKISSLGKLPAIDLFYSSILGRFDSLDKLKVLDLRSSLISTVLGSIVFSCNLERLYTSILQLCCKRTTGCNLTRYAC